MSYSIGETTTLNEPRKYQRMGAPGTGLGYETTKGPAQARPYREYRSLGFTKIAWVEAQG